MIGPWIKLLVALGGLTGIVLIFTGYWCGGIPVLLMTLFTSYMIRLHNTLIKDITLGGPEGPHGDAKYRLHYEDIKDDPT